MTGFIFHRLAVISSTTSSQFRHRFANRVVVRRGGGENGTQKWQPQIAINLGFHAPFTHTTKHKKRQQNRAISICCSVGDAQFKVFFIRNSLLLLLDVLDKTGLSQTVQDRAAYGVYVFDPIRPPKLPKMRRPIWATYGCHCACIYGTAKRLQIEQTICIRRN